MENDFEEIVVLTPNVLWAQKKDTISLKVLIAEVKKPKIDLTENSLTFAAEGSGAKGWNLYKFSLEFFGTIDREGCVYKVTPTCVELQLTKLGEGFWWPKLVAKEAKKPHFLKLDFDRWMSESDYEEEKLKKKAGEALKQASKDREKDAADVIQIFYLTMYNGAQLILYSIVMGICVFGRLIYGAEFYADTYNAAGNIVLFAILLAYLECLHSFLGYVKSPWYLSFMQTSGRAFAYFCLWLAGPEPMSQCTVWDLFVAWSAIELIRYPYYILQLYGKDAKVLTWLRYHAWIPLYPFGGFMEYKIYATAANLFEEQSKYVLTLPNVLNFSISLSGFIKVYSVLLFVGIMGMMRHLWKMRQRKYGKRRKLKPA